MILFSYDIFSAQAAGGVSRCMVELMRALASKAENFRLWAGVHTNLLLRAASQEHWTDRHVEADFGPRINTGRIRGALRNEVGFRNAAGKYQASIIHRSYHPVVDLAPKRPARIETVHDMWDERASSVDATLKSALKRRAVIRADHIVCVSTNTRNELLEIWPGLEDRVRVIPHGVRLLSDSSVPPAVSRPYFLFVGRRDLYKNFAVAVEALRISELADFDLICFGGAPFSEEEKQFAHGAGLASRIVHLAGGDAELAGLYEHATALLYPSAYEGFGLPLLEAMAHRCPVLAITTAIGLTDDLQPVVLQGCDNR